MKKRIVSIITVLTVFAAVGCANTQEESGAVIISDTATSEESIEETKLEEDHTLLETNEAPKQEEEEFEELETYVPRSSTYSEASDDEENDTDSGVDIDYNL